MTFCPSVNATRSNCPATCDFTCTMEEASTVPTTRNSVGTDSLVTLATVTGTTGGPAGPLACSFWHPASAVRQQPAEIHLKARVPTLVSPGYGQMTNEKKKRTALS